MALHMAAKIFAILFFLFTQTCASACSYGIPIHFSFDKNSVALKADDREKLMNWLQASLKIFPYVVVEINSNAHAPTKEKAKKLAQARGQYIKEKLLPQLPENTHFDMDYAGHISRKVSWLPSPDVVYITLMPDTEKFKLPPCMQPLAK